MRSLAIIVPAYNEAGVAERAIMRLLRSPLPGGVVDRAIIAVDDGSTDGTAEILSRLAEENGGLTVVTHERNRGKGAAIATGLGAAKAADLILIHDADLEYDPLDHGAVLAPLIDGRADAVMGSRFRGGTAHRVLYYWHSVANGIITGLSNALTNLNLSDIECCTKAFTRGVADRLALRERGFGIEPEIVARLARMRLADAGAPRGGRALRIFEVPVSYAGRTYDEGKKIAWPDALWAVWCIARYALGPLDAPPHDDGGNT